MTTHKEATELVRRWLNEVAQGCDFKICALVSAITHYRRSTVCNPFPDALFDNNGLDRDFEAVKSCLLALPNIAALTSPQPAALHRLSSQQVQLLHWLLNHPRRPAAGITQVAFEDVRKVLPSMSGWVSDLVHNPSLRPQCILQLQPFTQSDLQGKVLAFHGTHMENVHSILHLGLLNLSGTRLQRTGAAFGKGIYFSTELTVAFAFCHPGPTWGGSSLGGRQRCLLVCGIDSQHAKLDGDSQTPERYIVVDRSDVVTLYYAFLYSDDQQGPPLLPAQQATSAAAAGEWPQPGRQPARRRGSWVDRVGWMPLLALLYLMWLMYVGLRDNWPQVRRLCRRYLGVRLL